MFEVTYRQEAAKAKIAHFEAVKSAFENGELDEYFKKYAENKLKSDNFYAKKAPCRIKYLEGYNDLHGRKVEYEDTEIACQWWEYFKDWYFIEEIMGPLNKAKQELQKAKKKDLLEQNMFVKRFNTEFVEK